MRYLLLSDGDRLEMLAAIGAADMDAFFKDVPASALLDDLIDLPTHTGEMEVEAAIKGLAAKNTGAASAPFFLGAGAYHHHIPAAVRSFGPTRRISDLLHPLPAGNITRSLQALFEFQSQVAMITDMDVANASIYDGTMGCAEEAMMDCRVTRSSKVILSVGLRPNYLDVSRPTPAFWVSR